MTSANKDTTASAMTLWDANVRTLTLYTFKQSSFNTTLFMCQNSPLCLCGSVIKVKLNMWDLYWGGSGALAQEVKKSFSNQKVASSIPCQSVLEQGTELLIAPDVQCAISVNVKCVYICKSLWIND